MIQREYVMENRNTTSRNFQQIFERWVAQIEVIFRFQDLSEIVNDEVPTLKANADDVQQAAHKERRNKIVYGLPQVYEECWREK